MRRKILSAVAAISCLALTPASFAAGTPKRLIGTDGPGFTITMSKKTVRAGTYKIVIRDRSSIHNFHLTGPGVNKKTGVAAIGTTTWTVRAKEGHIQIRLRPATSCGRVLKVLLYSKKAYRHGRPGFTITMSKKTVRAGTYKIVIRDRSSIHNFHLTGPGVNKKTDVAAIGTTTWTVKLKKGA